MRVGELLLLLVAAMKRKLVAGTYIEADETPVDVRLLDWSDGAWAGRVRGSFWTDMTGFYRPTVTRRELLPAGRWAGR